MSVFLQFLGFCPYFYKIIIAQRFYESKRFDRKCAGFIADWEQINQKPRGKTHGAKKVS
jgi:hypothetical protein